MKFDKLILVGLTLILLLAGCKEPEKDDLTLPARIKLLIGLTEGYWDERNDLAYWGGYIGIQRIRFEGKREVGPDVFFETDPAMDCQPFDLQHPSRPFSSFDIPRGIYTSLKWEIDLKNIKTNEIINVEDLDSMNIGLYFSGSYDWYYALEEPQIHSVMLAVDDTVRLCFTSHENVKFIFTEGYEDRTYSVHLTFDPCGAFNPIPMDSIQNMEVTKNVAWAWSSKIILISSNKNENIYRDLLNKIIGSVGVN